MPAMAQYRRFNGKLHVLRFTAKNKSELQKRQKLNNYGGRIVELPKGHRGYVRGLRYGLYKPA